MGMGMGMGSKKVICTIKNKTGALGAYWLNFRRFWMILTLGADQLKLKADLLKLSADWLNL